VTQEDGVPRFTPQDRLTRVLLVGALGVGVAVVWLTYVVFAPLFSATDSGVRADVKAKVPAYDYQAWHDLPVQGGRTKPFETACAEEVLYITGRQKFEGLDPVAIVLAWVMPEGEGAAPARFTDWESYPFILCDHRGLRRRIYDHLAWEAPELTETRLNAKCISPADLRRSPGFVRLLHEAAERRKEDREKAHFTMSPEQLKAEEVKNRLVRFDAIRGRSVTALCDKALATEQFLVLPEDAEGADQSAAQAQERLERGMRQYADPFHLVGLDRVPGSAWFSRAELEAARRDPNKWRVFMEERLSEMPQRYISPDRLQALREFQELVKAGQGQAPVDQLDTVLRERRDKKVAEFEQALRANDRDQVNHFFTQVLLASKANQDRLKAARAKVWAAQTDQKTFDLAMVEEVRAILRDTDEAVLKRLRQGLDLARTKGYHAEDPEFRMFHLDYLESRYPSIYQESLAAQPFPAAEADQVHEAFARVREAYRSGDADRFGAASEAFFQTVRDLTDWTAIRGLAERNHDGEMPAALERVKQARTSGDREQIAQAQADFFVTVAETAEKVQPYPGVATIPLEMLYYRVQPFLWAWIIMFAALVMFIASMALRSRVCYFVAFALYLGSLGFQVFGFGVRIYLSGRAPVGTIYETVIFAAFMAGLFALILELIYRRRVIGMAGAAVATFGLVLADQLSLALDPKVSPLVPVLRTNYWLTIHVLTIVSSYAGGTLAWGLGNITLGLLAFGKGRRETLHTLSQFTYRAMQIAVLLLAAGTFLGGWWAAESWGRFWGWDPKEVGALIALVCYVIPLHARYIGWVKDFGLAVCAVLCYAAILLSWYAVNFLLAAGLHSYGFGGAGEGPWWVLWAVLLNLEWVLVASLLYRAKTRSLTSHPCSDESPPLPTEALPG
jgi:ABC-type transport system involved in cytochrome c biogenesis permease subunit